MTFRMPLICVQLALVSVLRGQEYKNIPPRRKNRSAGLSGGHTTKFLQKNYNSRFRRHLKMHLECDIQNAPNLLSARSGERFGGVGV